MTIADEMRALLSQLTEAQLREFEALIADEREIRARERRWQMTLVAEER